MNIQGKPYQSIALNQDGWSIDIIDQTQLPHVLSIKNLQTRQDVEIAIKRMWVRGAPLIGVTAAHGICLQVRKDASDIALIKAASYLNSTRPTAINLQWAVNKMKIALLNIPIEQRLSTSYTVAKEILKSDIAMCKRIGQHGAKLIQNIFNKTKSTVNILTHCNAGWLAAVDWGTALAPIYMAHELGIPVHVWVDETRPRNQGASLTAFELAGHGIDHTVVVDNVGGHLMQHGMVDLCLVGSDRCTRRGDICNKIGTYLKALAAYDNNVPFYAALPVSTIDWNLRNGVNEIPIEERSAEEVSTIAGVRIVPPNTKVANYGFDVTPAKLVSGIITERGICAASETALVELYEDVCYAE